MKCIWVLLTSKAPCLQSQKEARHLCIIHGTIVGQRVGMKRVTYLRSIAQIRSCCAAVMPMLQGAVMEASDKIWALLLGIASALPAAEAISNRPAPGKRHLPITCSSGSPGWCRQKSAPGQSPVRNLSHVVSLFGIDGFSV